MKIILSRKGFDSTAGGVPSPILPDGGLVSLPIPDPRSLVRYGDIGGGERDIGRLVSNLTGGRIRRGSRAHLDPDLLAADRPRAPGWRPLFGQEGAAQGHLRNQGVGPGDLFVFFGLFRRCRWYKGRYRFEQHAPRVHLIWGWLQVEAVIPVAGCPADVRRWAGSHPHFHHDPVPGNVLYVARRRLTGPGGQATGLPGAGVFERYRRSLRLTDRAATGPGLWRLPAWCRPGDPDAVPSYHRDRRRWRIESGVTRVQSAARGQEFVLPGQWTTAAWPLLAGLISRFGRSETDPG